MAVPFRIGVLQLSMEPTGETVRMAKACEEAGFDSFWLAEAYPWWRKHSMEARSSTAVTAIVARETRRIPIGWGIISPYTRHPVQIAMEARVLQETAGPGRFFLGLGASKIFMKEIGEGEKGAEASPATVMRESIEIVRGALGGKEFRYQGNAFSADLPALRADARVPSHPIPLYLGATGPVLQRMAGEIADGLLTASITTPAYSGYARGFLEEGARKAGRDPAELDLGGVIVGSIGRDRARAADGAREMAAMYLANKVQNIRGSADMLLTKAGLTFDEIRPIAEAMEQGGRRAAARAVTPEILSKVCAIAGTPDQCAERIAEYRNAGCTHILLEIWGEDRIEQAKLFGEAVLPHFKR
ncbi:MAG TPA: LLM class flavin-dependent oxidoreductase [Candidatus Acidoferrales bacterium]|nr:LLM class flavin-dependent oxidoreductase [Candidatus Acidoferrales bacterium]